MALRKKYNKNRIKITFKKRLRKWKSLNLNKIISDWNMDGDPYCKIFGIHYSPIELCMGSLL